MKHNWIVTRKADSTEMVTITASGWDDLFNKLPGNYQKDEYVLIPEKRAN